MISNTWYKITHGQWRNETNPPGEGVKNAVPPKKKYGFIYQENSMDFYLRGSGHG